MTSSEFSLWSKLNSTAGTNYKVTSWYSEKATKISENLRNLALYSRLKTLLLFTMYAEYNRLPLD